LGVLANIFNTMPQKTFRNAYWPLVGPTVGSTDLET